MARSSAAKLTGTRPACQAAPSITTLADNVSPNKASAMAWASSVRTRSAPAACCSLAMSPGACTEASGWRTKAAVTSSCRLAMICVRLCLTVPRASALAATTRSHASNRSACCVSMRTWFSRSAVGARRTKDSTEPPFCAKPMKSSTEAWWPSRCAAMVTSAPTVTTPVPPTPVTSMSKGPLQAQGAGEGSAVTSRARSCSLQRRAAGRASSAPSSVTKLGQKPLMQLKSLLHELCSMARLRPQSVFSGTMDRQLLCTPQSPQPSHTAGLMKTRLGGSGSCPFLRRRRFSAAQVWS